MDLARLGREGLKVSTLRMVMAAVKNFEIAKGGAGYSASSDEVLGVVQKEIKQRQESIESFEKGNREDLAGKEKKEMEILRVYLPPQMAEEEIRKLVEEAIRQTGVSTMAEMGKVMGVLMP